MSEGEATTKGRGQQWDAPNQQVVRSDQSAPWDQGTGGSGSTRSSGRKTSSKSPTRSTERSAPSHADDAETADDDKG